MRGADVFAPGVLGAPPSLRRGDAVSVFADVGAKCLRGTKTTEDAAAAKSPPSLPGLRFVGNGTATMSRDDIFKTNR